MGIYLPNMEMPKEGGAIVVYKISGKFFAARAGKDELFPIIPVPPHGDLIDANKLAELCDIMADKCDGIGVSVWHQFKTAVEWSPIVIPAEEK